jgi:RTX calcium-binding nonapeptide repeat (4 copies)
VIGGADFDTAHFNFGLSTVALQLDLTNVWSGGVGSFNGQAVSWIENLHPDPNVRESVTGSNFDDTIIIGNYPLATLAAPLYLDGADGNDWISGSAGADNINGGAGSDVLFGNDGNDIFVGSLGNDYVFGGNGVDSYSGNGWTRRQQDGSITITSANGVTTFSGVEFVNGVNTAERVTSNADNDADSDLIYFSSNTGLAGFTTVANGVLSDVGPSTEIGGPGAWQLVASGDVTGDGVTDAIFKLGSGNLARVWSPVTGVSFIAALPDRDLTFSAGEIVSMGDVDGNLISDIIWRDPGNGRIKIGLSGPTSNNAPVTDLGAFGAEWKVAGTGDVDYDFDDDIILRNDTNGRVYVLKMENGLVSGGIDVGTFGTAWTVDGVGDFNNDGRSDIALKNTASGQFYLLLMDGTGGYTGSSLGVIGTDWNIAATGDYNVDGTDDLLWRNGMTDQIYLWTMQDGQQLGSSPYGYLAADQIIV